MKQYKNIYEKPLQQQTKEEDIKTFESNSKLLKNELNEQLFVFKSLDSETIIRRGRESAKKCLKIINSLCKYQKFSKILTILFQLYFIFKLSWLEKSGKYTALI